MITISLIAAALSLDLLMLWAVGMSGLRRILIVLSSAADTAVVCMLLLMDGSQSFSSSPYASSLVVLFACFKLLSRMRAWSPRSTVFRTRRLLLRSALWLTAAQVAMLLVADTGYIDQNAVLWLLMAISAVLALFALYHHFAYRLPLLREHLTDAELPSVSILIPARNETDELVATLETIVALDYPKLEVLVLDDCSNTKKTSQIIKGFAKQGVRFIIGKEPRDDWLGKNNAYQELFDQASSEWLFFMGTDLRLDKHSLRNLLARVADTNLKMVSLMPFKDPKSHGGLFYPMRYWWEFVLPRGAMRRPPVLSSAWLVRRDSLKRFGGFKGVSRSVIPERHIARSVGADYTFWTAHPRDLWISTAKTNRSQYKTASLHRYPQLKRRLERVAAVTAVAGTFMLLPVLAIDSPVKSAVVFLLLYISLAVPSFHHVRLGGLIRAIFVLPLIAQETSIMLYSLYRYEFSVITWKGRNVCLPVMRVYKNLPKA